MNKTIEIKEARYVGHKINSDDGFDSMGGAWYYSNKKDKIYVFFIPISLLQETLILLKFEIFKHQEIYNTEYKHGLLYYKSKNSIHTSFFGYMKIINKEDFLEFMLSF